MAETIDQMIATHPAIKRIAEAASVWAGSIGKTKPEIESAAQAFLDVITKQVDAVYLKGIEDSK